MVEQQKNNKPGTLPDLKDPAVYEEFYNLYLKFARFDESQGAFILADNIRRLFNLQPEIENKYSDIYKKFDELRLKLKWIALSQYPEAEVLEMFHNHYTLTDEIPDLDIWQKLKLVLVAMVMVESRNDYKKQLINALRENNEKLTSENIVKDGKEQPGTIKNWLTDVRINLGNDYIPVVKLSDYLVNSQNTKTLSSFSRERLRKLLFFTNRLTIPSDSPAGYESVVDIDEDRDIGVIKEGVLDRYENIDKLKDEMTKTMESVESNTPSTETLQPKTIAPSGQISPRYTKPSANTITEVNIGSEKIKQLQAKDLIKIYSQNPQEQAAVYEEEKKILNQLGQGTINVRQELADALKNKNRPRLVAFIIVLAKTKDLFTVVASDLEFIQRLKENYGPEAEAQFKKTPADPIFYSLWLQYILREKLQMLESDSARIGIKLANLVGRRYLKVSYIDSVSGSFKWVPIKKDKDRLVLVS